MSRILKCSGKIETFFFFFFLPFPFQNNYKMLIFLQIFKILPVHFTNQFVPNSIRNIFCLSPNKPKFIYYPENSFSKVKFSSVIHNRVLNPQSISE